MSVYDLRADLDHVRAMQDASLHRQDAGLMPDPHLVGTDEWWSDITDERTPTVTVLGTVTRVWWGSMGDWPMFEVTASSGQRSEWTRAGDYARYVVGLMVKLRYVVQRYKEGVQLASFQDGTTELVLSVDLEASDERSPREVPGPFASG